MRGTARCYRIILGHFLRVRRPCRPPHLLSVVLHKFRRLFELCGRRARVKHFALHIVHGLTFPFPGGFGANTNNKTTFGSTPFGSSTTGGGLFGGGAGAASSGSTFGGFGANNNTTPSAFGSNNANTGGSLFGQNKTTGFGASTTGGGGLFGGGGNTTGGFGSTNTNTTGGFGASTGGFGAGNNPPQNTGTANTPFQAFSEKDGATGNASSQYQTITFQQPYQNYSLEELRVVDYNQGRRYGNQNGQAGAFGQSTGFGGFGSNNATTTASTGFGASTNTGGGLFGGGNTNNTTSSFGQNTGSAFGSNNNSTGGGLFGQAKPATGGLFGGSNTTSTTGTTGGLFGGGSATNTTGGFGSGGGGFGSTANNNASGGSLFGQAKPATGGLFGGSSTTTNTTSTPFGGGATNTGAFGQSSTGGGLFGQQNNQASSTPAFGASNTATNTGGGLFGGSTGGGFGQNTQTQPQAQASGGLFGGGGGFGQNNQQQNQQKPGGLFGGSTNTATTGGGLFGQSNQAQPSGGLFGSSTANNNTGGGLFGQKPAATGGSLFGGSTTNTGQSGGGLFGGGLGGQTAQQNTGGGLFGGQSNQQKPGGLFGGSTSNTNTGGGLFGGLGQSNNQQSTMGGSLFSSQNQQPQQQQNSNSLFGASGSSLLNTSMNTNPYGNDALFAGLATPTQSPGPIATPLSSSQKNKRSAILPQHKLNPSASTRLLTPQNKRAGYGFTYSTYGTPASASSQSSPGFGGSLFASGSLSRSLGKSLSTSNLRNSFTPETSILSPGAFSTTGRGFGNGSLKKLNVNRSINTRIPLFDEPSQKRVSFAGGETQNSNANGETALVVRRDDDDHSPPRSAFQDSRNETPRPSMQQVNGSELARVSEDHVLTPKSSSSVNVQPGADPKAGDYWSTPTVAQLRKMSQQDLRSVPNFVVGRHNIGQINFNHGKPVDLSEVNLDKLFGDIVQLNPRNATVYGETCTCLPKPPLGTALNQPSEIVLGNSWPRNRAGKKDVKHLERLKRVGGTTFIKYNQSNGEWTFTVPHFSSYGLDYDDYSDDEDESSDLSDAPDTPAQKQTRSNQMTGTPQEDSFVSPTQSQSSPDDTFDFKKGMRSRASVPGGFGDEAVYEEDEEIQETRNQSFLGGRSVGSLDGQHDADYSEESDSQLDQDQDMADSVSGPIQTTELVPVNEDPFKATLKPKSILKGSQLLRPGMGTPSKSQPTFDDDWANQLQRTISPRKQDRHVLRESQGNALREQDMSASTFSQSVGGRQITTAMDLMESLFGESEKQKLLKRGGHGIEV